MPGARSGDPLGFVHIPSLRAFVHPEEPAKIIRVTRSAQAPPVTTAAAEPDDTEMLTMVHERLRKLGVAKLGQRQRVILALESATLDGVEQALRRDPSLGGRVSVMSPTCVGAFVISLASAGSRRLHASEAIIPCLEGLDSPQLWDAVNGRSLRPSEQALVAPPSQHHMLAGRLRRGEYVYFAQPLNCGEVGCMLSHVAVLEEIVRRSLEQTPSPMIEIARLLDECPVYTHQVFARV